MPQIFLFIALAFAGLICPPLPTALGASLQTAPVRPAYRSVVLTGFTRAKRTMTITPEVSARCVSVTADIGDDVPNSTLLAKLDTTFIDLDLRRTEVTIRQTQSLIAYLEQETGRSRELVRRDTQARSELDRLEQDLDQARLNLTELQVSKNVLAEQKKRHLLHGPSGWTVIKREMEPGEWLGAGTPVGELGDFRTLRIPLALSPDELAALASMKDLKITLPDHDTILPASVFRIAPDFDPQTRKTSLDLLISPPPGLHRGGLRCELTLSLPEPEHTWLVPETALHERYETHWVTLEDGGEVQVILLGRSGRGFVRVNSAQLHSGDRLQVQP